MSITEEELCRAYAISPELCCVSLYSFGGTSEMAPGGAAELSDNGGGLLAELQGIAKQRQKEGDAVELLSVFGDHALCAISHSQSLTATTAAFRAARQAVWIQQIFGFRPEPLAGWLKRREYVPKTPPRIVALMLVKLRDDALLQDSHLFPVAFIEIVQELAENAAGGGLVCEPWLTVGPADLLFVLRADSLEKIGRFMNHVRQQTLGDIFNSTRGDVFARTLRNNRALAASADLQRWFEAQNSAWPHASADDFIYSLPVTSASRTIVGFARDTLDAVLNACKAAGAAIRTQSEGAGNPQSAVRAICERVFEAGSEPRKVLATAGITDEAQYHVSLNVQIKPGSGPALSSIFDEMRRVMLRSEGATDEHVAATCDRQVRSTFGVHDAVLLGPDTPVRFGTVILTIALIHYLSTIDPPLRRRIRHLMRCTLTRFEFERAPATKTPAELLPFGGDQAETQFALLSEHASRAYDALALALPPSEQVPWLPQHIYRAAERLVRLFDAGLRDIATGVHLLDLLPSMQTLVMIITTGQLVHQDNATAVSDWLTWQALPWLHGGHASRQIYQERLVIRHMVRLIEVLELALRQRLQQRLTEHSGDISIELAGGRHKWLSGIAVLVPALQERIIPHPDIFRWPGLCLLKLSERPIEVLIRFAIVQVGPDVLDQPESLLWLFQEIGQVALGSEYNQPAVQSLRTKVESRRMAPVARRSLLATLPELFGDLTLVFLGFDGDLESYGRFVIDRLARLAPRAALTYRHDVWERLFLVTFLLDKDARWAAFDARHGNGKSEERRKPRRPTQAEEVDIALMRFAKLVDTWCPPVDAQGSKSSPDLWQTRSNLLQRSVGPGAEPRLRGDLSQRFAQTAIDVFDLLTPEQLAAFQIGQRTVAAWAQSCQRRTRERPHEPTAPVEARGIEGYPRMRPTGEMRPPVCARNLQWEGVAPRAWPGFPNDTDVHLERIRALLASTTFPLVVPADMTEWQRDARKLASATDVEDRERVALLQSLWSASQGLKWLMLEKVRAAHATGLSLQAVVATERHGESMPPSSDHGAPSSLLPPNLTPPNLMNLFVITPNKALRKGQGALANKKSLREK